jgi:hypothetical protein
MPQGYKAYADPMQDRRRKLTPEQYGEIRTLYAEGTGLSQRELGRRYSVNRSTIAIIVDPARAEAVKKRIKDHWQEYSDRKKLTKAARSLRRHKKDLGLTYKIERS